MRPAAIPTVAAIVVVAITGSLGNWQLRRAAEKQALESSRRQAMVDAPLPVGAGPIEPAALIGRRIRVEGEFIAGRSVFIDNRTRRGVAGFHVVTPLSIVEPGRPPNHVLVLRGWIAGNPAERTRLPELVTPVGTVVVEGLAEADLAQPLALGADAEPGPAVRVWQRFSIDRYRTWSGLPVQPLLLRQTSELPDQLARDWVRPGPDVDRHRGYAFQWFAMAAVTAGIWLWFTIRRPQSSPVKSPR